MTFNLRNIFTLELTKTLLGRVHQKIKLLNGDKQAEPELVDYLIISEIEPILVK
jgi:hypothetical protein